MFNWVEVLLNGEDSDMSSKWKAIETSEGDLIGPEVRALIAAYENRSRNGIEGDIIEDYGVNVDDDGFYDLERPDGAVIEGYLAVDKFT